MLSANTVSKSRPVLRSRAETRAGKKLKKRLEEADSIIASGSPSGDDIRPAKPHATPERSFSKDCGKANTADLHHDQGRRPRDNSLAPIQQQCKEEPLDDLALLPTAHSLLPTSDWIVGGAAQSTGPSLSPLYPSTAVAIDLTTTLAVEYSPKNGYYVTDGGSPFEEGYLAMNGTCVAQYWPL